MIDVPLIPIPNQSFQIVLNEQNCNLQVFQTGYGLFMNVGVDNSIIINGVICEDANRIVRSEYLGFVGDFVFIDTQGSDDPVYTGLGSRFVLLYLTPAEVAANLVVPKAA